MVIADLIIFSSPSSRDHLAGFEPHQFVNAANRRRPQQCTCMI
jgi:hypothetical protein